MRQVVALVLIWSLIPPAFAAQVSPKEQAVAISRGNAVEVRFLDGSKTRGWIGAVSDSGFELDTEKEGKQQIVFDRVEAIRDLKKKTFGRSLGMGYLIGLVVAGVIGVTVAIVCRDGCWG